MRDIVIIAHDLRSSHNVGSLLRTADGMGVSRVYLTGFSPYPTHSNDVRLPHIGAKVTKDIHKTALGAENHVPWQYVESIDMLIKQLRSKTYDIVGIEQAPRSIALPTYLPVAKVALILGREVEGIDNSILKQCDRIVEIPMYGAKESFNVVQAAAMVLYHCRFAPFHI